MILARASECNDTSSICFKRNRALIIAFLAMGAIEHLVSFSAGFAYGGTSVCVGQPLDTVKTRMQALPRAGGRSAFSVASEIVKAEGLRGLYRGGAPIFIGGALFRSAQFGVYQNVLGAIREAYPDSPRVGPFDMQVVGAGFCGGVARGIVEGPFEFIKVRRQVEKDWKFNQVYKGSSATMVRNSFLFMSFAIYMDLSSQIVEGGLSPFWKGAICANLAWMTVWPMDVVKSRIQSGNYAGQSMLQLLVGSIKDRSMFRGLLPGLVRSTIANGCSMVVYTKVEKEMKRRFLEEDL